MGKEGGITKRPMSRQVSRRTVRGKDMPDGRNGGHEPVCGLVVRGWDGYMGPWAGILSQDPFEEVPGCQAKEFGLVIGCGVQHNQDLALGRLL